MTQQRTILNSSKCLGRHESVIIDKLVPFFKNLGYCVFPHSRFNIAWGNIISDIDLLAVKNNEITLVEVKSSKDNLGRAKKQLANIRDYVDYTFVATDYHPRKFPFRKAGWIYANERVEIMKKAQKINNTPTYFSVDGIPKKCLFRLCSVKHLKHKKTDTKRTLVNKLLYNNNLSFKKELQEIVTCNRQCDSDCPIWNFKQAQ